LEEKDVGQLVEQKAEGSMVQTLKPRKTMDNVQAC